MDNITIVLILILFISNILILFISNILIIFYIYKSNIEIKKQIKNSIEPKFLEIAISPDSNKIISLAIDVWRLEEKIINIQELNTNDKEKLTISINRVKKFIDENNIIIKGYSGEKYSDEVNVYELKGAEITDEIEKDNIIKDTIEPAVFIDGNIIKPAKIIIYKINS